MAEIVKIVGEIGCAFAIVRQLLKNRIAELRRFRIVALQGEIALALAFDLRSLIHPGVGAVQPLLC